MGESSKEDEFTLNRILLWTVIWVLHIRNFIAYFFTTFFYINLMDATSFICSSDNNDTRERFVSIAHWREVFFSFFLYLCVFRVFFFFLKSSFLFPYHGECFCLMFDNPWLSVPPGLTSSIFPTWKASRLRISNMFGCWCSGSEGGRQTFSEPPHFQSCASLLATSGPNIPKSWVFYTGSSHVSRSIF
jgi:hypothetical protein